jgi:cyclophilin family peptidyl-prolyl cis-trans isomerase
MLSLNVITLGLVILAVVTAGTARAANPVVVIDTNMGTIKVELFPDKAPVTVKNFLQYVADKHYDGLIFHRVISDFMIQGGGFEPGMKERKTREPIKNESDNGLSNVRGTIAMARTSVPDSATSQFFINVKDNTFLDKAQARDKVGYCVFGRVIEGMAVVDKIRAVKTGSKKGFDDVPVEDVIIKSVTVLKEEK